MKQGGKSDKEKMWEILRRSSKDIDVGYIYAPYIPITLENGKCQKN